MTDILKNSISSKRYNFNPKIWGPHAWFYHDTVVLSYPDRPDQTTKENYKYHFLNIYKTLPCQKCQYNYQNHLADRPLRDNDLASRDALVTWWVGMHNAVKKMQGEKEITVEEFLKYYADQYSKNRVDDSNTTRAIVFMCMIALLFYLAKDFMMLKRN
jgi:hypothetical protein